MIDFIWRVVSETLSNIFRLLVLLAVLFIVFMIIFAIFEESIFFGILTSIIVYIVGYYSYQKIKNKSPDNQLNDDGFMDNAQDDFGRDNRRFDDEITKNEEGFFYENGKRYVDEDYWREYHQD